MHRAKLRVATPRHPRTMQIQTILNRLQKQPGFVYGKASLHQRPGGRFRLDVEVRARKGSRGVCSNCMKRRPTYDHQPQRAFQFVPIWGIVVFLLCAPRRVECPKCGVKVELLPWCDGKHQLTTTFAWFLASWA